MKQLPAIKIQKWNKKKPNFPTYEVLYHGSLEELSREPKTMGSLGVPCFEHLQ